MANSIHISIPAVCRTWSPKHTQNNTLCLPISKDYKTRPSRPLKHLHIYTYPYNGLLKAIHVPVFLKLERKLPASGEMGMVFQAGWSDHSNSSHSMTQSLHLHPETTVWIVLGLYIATLALFIALGMCPAVSLSMEPLQEEIFSVSATFPSLEANQVQQPKLWVNLLSWFDPRSLSLWMDKTVNFTCTFHLFFLKPESYRKKPALMTLPVEGNIVI